MEFLHQARQMLQMPLEWQEKLEKIEWARFYAHPDSEIALGHPSAHLNEKEREEFLHFHKDLRHQFSPRYPPHPETRPPCKGRASSCRGNPPWLRNGAVAFERSKEDQRQLRNRGCLSNHRAPQKIPPLG